VKETRFTPEAVTAAIRKVVANRGGGFTYFPGNGAQCVYSTKKGEPDCIVGHVIAEIAPDVFKKLHEYEYGGPHGPTSVSASWLCDALSNGGPAMNGVGRGWDFGTPEDVSKQVSRALQAAQNAQDGGQTWGEALSRFESVISGEGFKR